MFGHILAAESRIPPKSNRLFLLNTSQKLYQKTFGVILQTDRQRQKENVTWPAWQTQINPLPTGDESYLAFAQGSFVTFSRVHDDTAVLASLPDAPRSSGDRSQKSVQGPQKTWQTSINVNLQTLRVTQRVLNWHMTNGHLEWTCGTRPAAPLMIIEVRSRREQHLPNWAWRKAQPGVKRPLSTLS